MKGDQQHMENEEVSKLFEEVTKKGFPSEKAEVNQRRDVDLYTSPDGETGEVHPKPKRDENGRWKKGSSGSPQTQFKDGNTLGKNGRRNAVSDLLREMGEEKKGDRSRMESVLNRLYQLAENGEINAIKELLNRVWGRTPEVVRTQDIPPDELVIR